MATLSVAIMLMHLGSFTYPTFGSHCGKSFKLCYRKNQDPQGLHPAEILKVLKRKGLLVSFSCTVEPRLSRHRFSGLFNYPDFFSGPIFFMNIDDLKAFPVQLNLDYPDIDDPDFSIIRTFSLVPFFS